MAFIRTNELKNFIAAMHYVYTRQELEAMLTEQKRICASRSKSFVEKAKIESAPFAELKDVPSFGQIMNFHFAQREAFLKTFNMLISVCPPELMRDAAVQEVVKNAEKFLNSKSYPE